MNHLRDLLDEEDDKISRCDELSDQQFIDVMAMVRSDAEGAVCFFAGEVGDLDGVKPVEALLRFPFETCWFEFLVKDSDEGYEINVCALFKACAEGGFGAHMFMRWNRGWRLVGSLIKSHDRRDWRVFPDNERERSEVMVSIVMNWYRFLSAMNCNNTELKEHAISAKLQKARAKRGKKPLFSYWTLHLSNKNERGEDLGGTHASPRVHLRRGHPRQYKPGLWTWVQPCMVGRGPGMVHKDYDGSGLSASAAR